MCASAESEPEVAVERGGASALEIEIQTVLHMGSLIDSINANLTVALENTQVCWGDARVDQSHGVLVRFALPD